MRKLYVLLIVLFNLGWLQSLRATHIAGSDMEFQCLGNDSFKLIFRIYRDCSPGNAALGSSIPVSFTPVSCNLNPVTVNINRESVTPIRFKCNGREWASICENGTFPFGIEEHLYTQVVHLKTLFPSIDSTCCLVKVGWTSCCRNGAITNIVDPLTQGFTNEGVINRCITPCNSSPQFTNKPIVAVCAGQPNCYNMGVVDTIDFDSLSFEFADPLGTGGSTVPFAAGFSKDKPLNFLGFPHANLPFPPAGIHLNPQNGDLCFTPMGQQQAVLAIKITEWRKINGQYVKIGETRRDAQLYSWQCPPNNPPEIEVNGSKAGNWKFDVCAGSSLCINIIAKDKDTVPPVVDTTTLSWNRGIPGGIFTNVNTPKKIIREDEAVFCWTPTDNQVSSLPYYFTVTAEDMGCPAATTTRAVAILVRPRPVGTHRVTRIACSDYLMQMQLTNGHLIDSTQVQYKWEISTDNHGTFVLLNARSYSGKVAEHTFTRAGTYVIRSTMASPQCRTYYYDTVEVDDPLQAIAPADTFICKGLSLTLAAHVKFGLAPYTYVWENVSTHQNISITPETKVTHVLIVIDSAGCKAFDTVVVDVKPLPKVNLGPDKRICYGDSVLLDPGTNDGKGFSVCNWSSVNGFSGSKPFLYVRDSIRYVVTGIDSFKCRQSDTVDVFVNKPLKPELGVDDSVCVFDTIILKPAQTHESYQWFESGSNTLLSGSFSLKVVPQLAGNKTYILKTEETYKNVTCPQADTIAITALALPVINIPNPTVKLCVTGSWIDFDIKTSVQPKGGKWWFDDSTKNHCFNQNPVALHFGHLLDTCLGPVQNEKITYFYKDNFGCKNNKSANLTLLSRPVVVAGPDKSFCNNEPSFNINPYPNTGVGTSWNLFPSDSALCQNCLESKVRTHTFYPAKANPGTLHLVYKAVSQNGCENTDTLIFEIKPVPQTEAGNLNPICENNIPVVLNQLPGVSPADGKWSGPGVDPVTQVFNPKAGAVVKSPLVNILRYKVTNAFGCTGEDSLNVLVHALPSVQLNGLPEKICENSALLPLNGLPKSPAGSYYINRNKVSSSLFNPSRNNPFVQEGVNELVYSFKNPLTGCANADTAYITIQYIPEISVFTPATGVCEGIPFALRASMLRSTALLWTRDGDGLFAGQTTSTDSIVIYTPGVNDNANSLAQLYVVTTDSGVCPAARKNVTIPINPKPTGDFTSGREGCEPYHVAFKGSFSGASSYMWNFGDSAVSRPDDKTYHIGYGKSINHTYPVDGKYKVSVFIKSDAGCENVISKPDWISVYNTPTAAFVTDKDWTTVALPRFSFGDKSSGFTEADQLKYQWQFGDLQTLSDTSSSKNPTYTYAPDTGTFLVTLRIQTVNGCESEAEKLLNIRPDITISAPTAFRPGSKEKGKPLCIECQNDKFYIVVDGEKTFHLNIFNRWGEMVFSTNNPNEGWDGKFKNMDCQQDVYAWELTLTSFNGSPYKYSGTVTLIR